MNIIILNTNSFGGNYEYSRCLAKAYLDNPHVNKCLVVLPSNAAQVENNVFKKTVCYFTANYNGIKFGEIHFLYRAFYH